MLGHLGPEPIGAIAERALHFDEHDARAVGDPEPALERGERGLDRPFSLLPTEPQGLDPRQERLDGASGAPMVHHDGERHRHSRFGRFPGSVEERGVPSRQEPHAVEVDVARVRREIIQEYARRRPPPFADGGDAHLFQDLGPRDLVGSFGEFLGELGPRSARDQVKPGEVNVCAGFRGEREVGRKGLAILVQAVHHDDDRKVRPLVGEVVSVPLPRGFGDHSGTSGSEMDMRRRCSTWHADSAIRSKSAVVHRPRRGS